MSFGWAKELTPEERRHKEQQEWCIRKATSWRRQGIKDKDITYKHYKKILDSQDGKCAICGRAPKPNKMLALDHDHNTGLIRGILCTQCNFALAQFEKDNRLMKAFNYLRKHKLSVENRD